MPLSDWGYPEQSTALEYLWHIFIELHNTRSSGMAIQAITYQEIKAYAEMTKQALSIFDVSIIKRLDYIAMSELAKDNNG